MNQPTLRILFTLAILVGMAAAPGAQTFPGRPAEATTPPSAPSASPNRCAATSSAIYATPSARWTCGCVTPLAPPSSRAAMPSAPRPRLCATPSARPRTSNARFALACRRKSARRFAARSARTAAASTTTVTVAARRTPAPSGRSAATPIRAATTTRAIDDYEQHCEVRDSTMPAGPLNVDAGQNGGISVEGWDRNEIRVRAIVRRPQRVTSPRARELAGQVQVQAGGGRVYATGPDNLAARVVVGQLPHQRAAQERSRSARQQRRHHHRRRHRQHALRHHQRRRAPAGPRRPRQRRDAQRRPQRARSAASAGTAKASMSRPATAASTLAIPEGYNAELETRTVNGGLRIDFPITVQGELTVATRPQHDARLRRPARTRADDQRRRQYSSPVNATTKNRSQPRSPRSTFLGRKFRGLRGFCLRALRG